jgi:predicted HTH domain antitoxin
MPPRRRFGLAGKSFGGDTLLMQMQVEYPDRLPDVLQTTRSEFEAEAWTAMAVKLFERKRLSSGLAARLARMSRI